MKDDTRTRRTGRSGKTGRTRRQRRYAAKETSAAAKEIGTAAPTKETCAAAPAKETAGAPATSGWRKLCRFDHRLGDWQRDCQFCE